LVEKQDYSRALLEFKNAARLQPKSGEPYYQAALAYLGMGDYGRAYSNLVRATELDPKHVKAQEKLAEIIGSSINNTWDAHSLEEAQKRIQSVLASVPSSQAALNALGLDEYLLGKPGDAEKHLEAALEEFPGNLKAATRLAMIKVNQKDLAGAEKILLKLAADSPHSPEAQLALGRFYMLTKRRNDAESAYHRASGIDPKYAPAMVDLVNLQFSAGNTAEAEKTLLALSALPDKRFRHLHAVYLFDHGRPEEALREFDQQAAADPKDGEALNRLMSAYLTLKRFPEAERAVNGALTKNPLNVNSLLARSRLYVITLKLDQAESDLRQVLHEEPNSAQGRYLLGKVAAARGQKLAAQQQFIQALESDPSLLAARLELALSLTAGGAGKTALEFLDKTPANQKNLLPVIVARNWALFGAGDRATLRKSIDAALAAYPQDPDLALQDGVLRSQEKDVAGARKSFDRALAARPDNTVAVDLLAKTFVAGHQDDEALKTVQEYAGRQPASAALQNLLGDWLASNHRRDEARKAYRAALAADPSLVKARMSLAFQDIAENKLDSARQALTPLAAAPATQIDAETSLGLLELKAGNETAAILHFRKVIAADPNNLISLNDLAYLLANRGDQLDEALKYAQQAKELDPNNATIDDTIGWAFYRKGLYGTALTHLKDAAAKNRTAAVYRYHLAMAYMKVGDQLHGRQALEEARRIDPKLPEAASASQLEAGVSEKN
jgi:tetratricopeptide (TPR) repeat protein